MTDLHVRVRCSNRRPWSLIALVRRQGHHLRPVVSLACLLITVALLGDLLPLGTWLLLSSAVVPPIIASLLLLAE